MDNTQLNNSLEKLLPLYLAGKLSAEDKVAVENWLDESSENQKIARDLQYIYVATDILHTLQSVDTLAALRKVKKGKKKPIGAQLLLWFQRIAAFLLLPLLIATFYNILHTDEESYVESFTNPGMVSSVQLPDGSKVWLNSGSTLKYPQKFTGGLREVELNGEAYFSVKKDNSKIFVVHTPSDLKVEVLGTEFNIEAYKESKSVHTTLVAGSVKLSYFDKHNHLLTVLMHPGEEVVYNTISKRIQIDKPYVPTQTAWKDGMVILKDTPLSKVLKILSKRFNTQFRVKNDNLYQYSFTGPFDAQQLPLILEHFRLSSGIQYRFITPEVEPGQAPLQQSIVELY